MRSIRPLTGSATGYCALVAGTVARLPRRAVLRQRYAKMLSLGGGRSQVATGEVAALLRIKNEDFWIEVILRVVCKVFREVIVIDSGSQDKTLQILDDLAREGLNFRLFCHREPPARMTLIANLIVDRCIQSEWVYLVDGDEIQFEDSARTLVQYCRTPSARVQTRRIACHQLIAHPDNILRCTPPLCSAVRYMHGRAYRRQKVHLSERGLSDAFVANLGLPGTNNLMKDSVFLENVLLLHCPLNQRSTIPTHRGFVDLLPQGAAYRTSYRAADDEYIKLPFFPKEVLECKYSPHNHYLKAVENAGITLV